MSCFCLKAGHKVLVGVFGPDNPINGSLLVILWTSFPSYLSKCRTNRTGNEQSRFAIMFSPNPSCCWLLIFVALRSFRRRCRRLWPHVRVSLLDQTSSCSPGSAGGNDSTQRSRNVPSTVWSYYLWSQCLREEDLLKYDMKEVKSVIVNSIYSPLLQHSEELITNSNKTTILLLILINEYTEDTDVIIIIWRNSLIHHYYYLEVILSPHYFLNSLFGPLRSWQIKEVFSFRRELIMFIIGAFMNLSLSIVNPLSPCGCGGRPPEAQETQRPSVSWDQLLLITKMLPF